MSKGDKGTPISLQELYYGGGAMMPDGIEYSAAGAGGTGDSSAHAHAHGHAMGHASRGTPIVVGGHGVAGADGSGAHGVPHAMYGMESISESPTKGGGASQVLGISAAAMAHMHGGGGVSMAAPRMASYAPAGMSYAPASGSYAPSGASYAAAGATVGGVPSGHMMYGVPSIPISLGSLPNQGMMTAGMAHHSAAMAQPTAGVEYDYSGGAPTAVYRTTSSGGAMSGAHAHHAHAMDPRSRASWAPMSHAAPASPQIISYSTHGAPAYGRVIGPSYTIQPSSVAMSVSAPPYGGDPYYGGGGAALMSSASGGAYAVHPLYGAAMPSSSMHGGATYIEIPPHYGHHAPPAHSHHGGGHSHHGHDPSPYYMSEFGSEYGGSHDYDYQRYQQPRESFYRPRTPMRRRRQPTVKPMAIALEDPDKKGFRRVPVLGQPPRTNNVNVAAVHDSEGRSLKNLRSYLVRARRLLRLEKQCTICGIGQAVSVVVEVVEQLKRERVGEIDHVKTDLTQSPMGETHMRPSLEVSLVPGEWGHLVSDFRRRKVIEIFEIRDKDASGSLSAETLLELNLPERFLANDEQTDIAEKLIEEKESLQLPEFLDYASALIHPLLLEYHFKQAIHELGGNVDLHDGPLPAIIDHIPEGTPPSKHEDGRWVHVPLKIGRQAAYTRAIVGDPIYRPKRRVTRAAKGAQKEPSPIKAMGVTEDSAEFVAEDEKSSESSEEVEVLGDADLVGADADVDDSA